MDNAPKSVFRWSRLHKNKRCIESMVLQYQKLRAHPMNQGNLTFCTLTLKSFVHWFKYKPQILHPHPLNTLWTQWNCVFLLCCYSFFVLPVLILKLLPFICFAASDPTSPLLFSLCHVDLETSWWPPSNLWREKWIGEYCWRLLTVARWNRVLQPKSSLWLHWLLENYHHHL